MVTALNATERIGNVKKKIHERRKMCELMRNTEMIFLITQTLFLIYMHVEELERGEHADLR